jgi:acyl-coenzyme A synthetase/AMP-(fatty) acid ligase
MSSLPKNANGKIDRRALRELFAAEADPHDPSLPGQSRQLGLQR